MPKRLLTLVLVLCMAAGAVLLPGCGPTSLPGESGSETETEKIVIPEETYYAQGTTEFATGRQCLYTVIHQDTPKDMYTEQAMETLTDALASYGIYADTKADTMPSFVNVEDNRLEREIVLGYTNRAESGAYDMGKGQYLYGMSEKGHIFILAQRSEDLEKVTRIFTDHVLPHMENGSIPLVPGFVVRFDEDGRLTEIKGSDPYITAPDEDENLLGWFDYGTALYMQKKFFVGPMRSSFSFSMAKNEYEGFEYILTSDSSYEGLLCEVTPLSDGEGHTLVGDIYVAYYTNITKGNDKYLTGYCPDAMLPQKAEGFGFKGGQSQTLYVLYKTTKDTVPGTYKGTLNIKKDGKILKTGEVSLKVWDICYDEETAFLSAFGNSFGNWFNPDNLKESYDIMVDYRLSSYTIPYDVDSEAFDTRVRNPRITSVMINVSDAGFIYEKYKGEPEILEKLYFYPVDEPSTPEDFENMLYYSNLIRERFPDADLMTPFYKIVTVRNEEGEVVTTTFKVIEDTSNWICTKTNTLDIAEVRDWAMNLKKERGARIYSYVCGEQKPEYTDFLAETPGTDKRVLFWQHYWNDVDGLLYWCYGYAGTTGDIWNKGAGKTDTYLPTTDGCLMYSDPETGRPVVTLGLQSVRDGVEDFQLLCMAERLLGREQAMAYAERIGTTFDTFTTDENTLMYVYEELAAAVEAALRQ